MHDSAATTVLTSSEGYRRWAKTYDEESNPILSLEQRYLEPLLPPTRELDVLDFGCGTGRWLNILSPKAPRSLLGIDSSLEMLRKAKKKLKSAARLVRAEACSVKLIPDSTDLVFGNFMLSYIEDSRSFLSNVRTVLRENGSFFLTDIHPDTSAALKWRRGVRGKDGFQQIRTFERSIGSVIAVCEAAGLQLCARLEPCFGALERKSFVAAGKLESFIQAAAHPAIYILQFKKLAPKPAEVLQENVGGTIRSIQNASIALGADERIFGPLTICDSRIATIGAQPELSSGMNRANSSIDLRGFLLMPGLVNAHDHLEFALFPRLGTGGYSNWLDWAEDIHRTQAAVIARHRLVPKDVRLWWGGLRNLLCGVTTVSHHNPYDANVFDNDFVVRVVRDYGWAHSLAMDSDVARKKLQTPFDQPFLIHLGEGIDRCSEKEISELSSAGVLDEDTVLIHGLALNNKGMALLNSSGAGLIWCPSSNVFLFGRTLTESALLSLSNIALGSDSPLTADGDLLDEVRFAASFSQVDAELVYKFVTRQAAQLLKLREGQGSIWQGSVADFFAVRDTGQSPAETLIELSYKDIELVMVGGRVHLASEEMMRRLPEGCQNELQPLSIEGTLRWVRAPLDRLFHESCARLPEGIFVGRKRVTLGVTH